MQAGQGETTEEARAILDALAQPVVIVGAEERITHINPAAEALFGAGLEGRHYAVGLRQPQLLDAIEQAMSTRALRTAHCYLTRHGRDADYEVRATPLALATGAAVLVSFTDVTMLEEAGQIRRDFVANVSHELKTPLTAMAGFIETLRGAARDDPAARERFLDIMAREAERMNRLVQDLLSLSRVEAEERQRPTAQVDLADTVRRALARLRGQAATGGIEVEEDLGTEPFIVPGDADQLMQVFLNLIENAMKYGAAGKRVTVRLSRIDHDAALRSAAVRAEVIDYGEGIAERHLPRLTERFYRVDNHRSREKGGTGLGLAIVKHIVNRHRGRLRIESRTGQGSSFSVILPAA